jgi:cytochrome c553
MSLVRIAVAAIAASAVFSAHAAGNADAGKGKVYQCQGCHGIPGWKTAFPEVYSVPKLGGQRAPYIVAALKAYKSGERDFQTMRAVVSDLTEQDMADIAAYYEAAGSAATKAASAPKAGEQKK